MLTYVLSEMLSHALFLLEALNGASPNSHITVFKFSYQIKHVLR